MDLLGKALVGRGVAGGLNDAMVATFICDPHAISLLDTATGEEKRTFLYWLLRVRASAIVGSPEDSARLVTRLWGGGDLTPEDADATLGVLDENDANGFSADLWGYRRVPIDWPSTDPALPSPLAGSTRWLVQPGSCHWAGNSRWTLRLLPTGRFDGFLQIAGAT